MIQQTSLLAYRGIKTLGNKQLACQRAIETLGNACNQDISEYLNWDINRVTPRVKELREKGIVVEAYRDINPSTDRKVIYWRIK